MTDEFEPSVSFPEGDGSVSFFGSIRGSGELSASPDCFGFLSGRDIELAPPDDSGRNGWTLESAFAPFDLTPASGLGILSFSRCADSLVLPTNIQKTMKSSIARLLDVRKRTELVVLHSLFEVSALSEILRWGFCSKIGPEQ